MYRKKPASTPPSDLAWRTSERGAPQRTVRAKCDVLADARGVEAFIRVNLSLAVQYICVHTNTSMMKAVATDRRLQYPCRVALICARTVVNDGTPRAEGTRGS